MTTNKILTLMVPGLIFAVIFSLNYRSQQWAGVFCRTQNVECKMQNAERRTENDGQRYRVVKQVDTSYMIN